MYNKRRLFGRYVSCKVSLPRGTPEASRAESRDTYRSNNHCLKFIVYEPNQKYHKIFTNESN